MLSALANYIRNLFAAAVEAGIMDGAARAADRLSAGEVVLAVEVEAKALPTNGRALPGKKGAKA